MPPAFRAATSSEWSTILGSVQATTAPACLGSMMPSSPAISTTLGFVMLRSSFLRKRCCPKEVRWIVPWGSRNASV